MAGNKIISIHKKLKKWLRFKFQDQDLLILKEYKFERFYSDKRHAKINLQFIINSMN